MVVSVLLGGFHSVGRLALSAIARTEDFDSLLRVLGPDRDTAGARYQEFRERLVRLFRLWGSDSPEDAADVTIERVTTKVAAGEVIRHDNPYVYFHGIARFVFMEQLRARFKERSAAAEAVTVPAAGIADEGTERRSACLEECLGKLESVDKSLVLGYYETEDRTHIDKRQTIAESLGITLTALRLRVHRLRERLRPCVADCSRNGNALGDTSR